MWTGSPTYCWRVRQALNAQGFPDVDHIELFGPPVAAGSELAELRPLSRGTPTTARPAAPAPAPSSPASPPTASSPKARTWIQESIIGSTFTGIVSLARSRDGQIEPVITGRAFVNAEATLLLDDRDPFCWGIR